MALRRKQQSQREQQRSFRDGPPGKVEELDDDYDPSSAKTGSCFIATAVYGTPMAEEIQVLRRYRDEFLLRNLLGKLIVDCYYSWSPPIARFLTRHRSVAGVVRKSILTLAVRVTSSILK